MSKTVSDKSNLNKARQVNKSRFKTMIHRYPDVMTYIRQGVQDGKAKVQIYKTALEKFPDYDLPSQPAFYSWIDKYGQVKETVVVSPYVPDYQLHMKNHDSYKEGLWALNELKNRYINALEKEKQMGGLPLGTTTNMLVRLIEKEIQFSELEIKLHLRTGDSSTPNVTFNQQNNTLQVDGSGVEVKKDELEEMANAVRADIKKLVRTNENVARISTTESRGTRAVATTSQEDS